MGGLLSSDNGEEQRRKEAAFEAERLQQVRWHQQQQEADFRQRLDFERQQQRAQLLLAQQRRQSQQLQRIKEMEEQRQVEKMRIGPVRVIPTGTVNSNGYELIPVVQYTSEYSRISAKFRETGKATMQMISLHKINNPFMKTLYDLKKLEVIRNYHMAREQELFHGTLRSNLSSICKNNFDRRKCVNHKFGYGVSFSPISFYATHYCDKGNCEKIMLLCKVIVTRPTMGNQFTHVPPAGFDSTQNAKGHVFVKYDDYTYYPEYVITYKFGNPARNAQSLEHMLGRMYLHDDYDYDIY